MASKDLVEALTPAVADTQAVATTTRPAAAVLPVVVAPVVAARKTHVVSVDDVESNNALRVIETFDAMKLREELLRGIDSYGFEKPSVIQKCAMLPILDGVDTVVESKSGTGKTALFAMATLQKIDPNNMNFQALILTPTRELAQAIQTVVRSLGNHMSVSTHACIGGTAAHEDFHVLSSAKQIIIGTPDRVLERITEGRLRLDDCIFFCLDELDQLLGRGFKDEVCGIFRYLRRDAQRCAFSSTMPSDALELTSRFMCDPNTIKLTNPKLNGTLCCVKQFYIDVEREDWKLDTLCDLLDTITMATSSSTIYCNTRRKVEWLVDKLKSRDFTVLPLHGGMCSDEREANLRDYRSHPTFLVAEDSVVSDIKKGNCVSIVINYDLPTCPENYFHRVCHASRNLRKCVAFTLMSEDIDTALLREIESKFDTTIEECPLYIADFIY